MRNPIPGVLLGSITSILLVGVADGLDGWAPDKFRRMFHHSSIVVDETVYIIGGELHLKDGEDFFPTALDSTLSIPLNKSWTNSSVEIKAKHYPSGFPYMNAQGLWWDPSSKSIYAYGGGTTVAGSEGTDQVDPLSVWGFATENNIWTERYGPDDDLWDNMTRATRCASAYTPESGYCLGGYSGPWSTDINTPTSSIPIGGMVEFDFETTTWSNISSVGSSERGWTVDQEMEYAPVYGKKGILLAIGGHELPEQEQYVTGENLRSMANITIYDINTKTWHSQNATGDIPSGRSEFCSVAVQGDNSDTFEIFVFGGKSGTANSDSDQVYILSLPAFRWFRTPATTQPRYMQTCEVVGGRQMLVIGGAHAQRSNTVDPWGYGLGIFDMVDWEWKAGYDAKASAYKTPDTIKQFYEENSKYPEWESEGVKAIIKDSANPPSQLSDADSDPTLDTESFDPASPLDLDSPPEPSVPVGAIVGGVVGGIGALAIIMALALFLLRREKKKRDGSNGPKELEVPPEYRSKDPFVHTRTPNGGPGELESSSPDPHLKENNHPRSWGDRVKELQGQQPGNTSELAGGETAQQYHRGQPVRVPAGGVVELQS